MVSSWITRGISLILLIVLCVSLFFGSSYLSLLAPFSGSAWSSAKTVGDSGEKIENPYGKATVRYDSKGIPHIEAENEKALYYAVGYVQAKDRLFQMDLYRRRMSGELSKAFGNRTLESDIFHRKMDFEKAAKASWQNIENQTFRNAIKAYSAGVNRYIEKGTTPLEFELLGYEPGKWKPSDTLLIGKQISWGLTGSFADLRRQVVKEKLGKKGLSLYPRSLNHRSTILGRSKGGNIVSARTISDSLNKKKKQDKDEVSPELAEWASKFEYPDYLGSNNWIVGGNHTKSGRPLLANDPHLLLTSPPVWYRMHLKTPGMNVSGVTFAGTPSIVIGQNQKVSWGVTNFAADVIDFYTYKESGNKYLYKGEKKKYKTRTETIEVSGGEDKKIKVRKTVHGPVIERESKEVAVAWTGMTATKEALAIYRFNHADSVDEFREAQRFFDVPAQNTVVIDREGNTMYYPAGKFPIRRIDGEKVRGNQVFNGSAGEGEWKGFTPYGKSTWEGFVPFEEIPHRINPEYLATANQRPIPSSNYSYYLGDSNYFASPYRGMRIYEMIEEKIDAGEKITPEYMKKIQRDTYSKRAELFVPYIEEAKAEMSGDARSYAETVSQWNMEMKNDSKGALIFSIWVQEYMNKTFHDEFSSKNLDDSYYPRYWRLQTLNPESDWFDNESTTETENRNDIVVEAMQKTVEEIEEKEYEVYGDYNQLDIRHPFDLGFLNYPKRGMDGSGYTVFNFRRDQTQRGSSVRIVASFNGKNRSPLSYIVIPGGNSGNYYSPHYYNQLETWINGGYKNMSFEAGQKENLKFVKEDEK